MPMSTMKCTQRADLLVLPAVMFGFHPTESCVFMGMRGNAVAFTARADLDWHVSGFEELSVQLGSAAHEAGAEDFILLGYSSDADLGFLSVSEAIAAVGIERVREALVTDGDRFWSLDDGEPQQFSFDSSAIAAQAVFEGRVVAKDRAAVTQAVQAWCPASDEQVEAQRRHLAGVARPYRLLERLLHPSEPLTDEEALQLALLLDDARYTDEVIADLSSDDAEEVWPQLLAARRVAPPEAEANALAVLSLAAWLKGGGAEYTACIEQMRERAPEHPVTATLCRLHELGIPPRRWGYRQ